MSVISSRSVGALGASLLAGGSLAYVVAVVLLGMTAPALSAARAVPLSGTVGTCDETALRAALAGGGTVTFATGDCTITLAATILITAPTTIDGAGQNITLSGGGAVRIIIATAEVGTLSVRNLTLTHGFAASGEGGALYVQGNLALSNTMVISNTASRGGGASVFGDVTLNRGLFLNNHALGHSATGGGLSAGGSLVLTDTQFINNSAARAGGGVLVGGAATLKGGLFQNNRVTPEGVPYPYGEGGGLYANSTLVLNGTKFLSNTAGSPMIATYGGGVYANGAAALSNGLFQNNIAQVGGGLCAISAFTLTGIQFNGNAAIFGGGAFVFGAAAISGGLFQYNSASIGGGLGAGNFLNLTGTRFLSNTALGGGGLDYDTDIYVRQGRIVNALFAGNVSTRGYGDAISFNGGGGMQILHATIGRTAPATGTAIFVYTGTVGITNTIIASHSVGISYTRGTVYADYNLFYGNVLDKSGAIGGGMHDVSGDPAFVNPAAGDYRIRASSAAIDAGADAGITTDFEGDIRPQGAGFDIGFDEGVAWRIWLPFLAR